MRKSLLLVAMATPAIALAADMTLSFQLAQDPGNLTDCIGLAPAFDRPFTLTAAGSTVTLTSPDGINLAMTPAGPNRYHAVFELSGERLDYTADLGARTLPVRGNNLGCKWSATAQ